MCIWAIQVRSIGVQNVLLRNPYILFYELIRRNVSNGSGPMKVKSSQLCLTNGDKPQQHAAINGVVRTNSDKSLLAARPPTPLYRHHSEAKLVGRGESPAGADFGEAIPRTPTNTHLSTLKHRLVREAVTKPFCDSEYNYYNNVLLKVPT